MEKLTLMDICIEYQKCPQCICEEGFKPDSSIEEFKKIIINLSKPDVFLYNNKNFSYFCEDHENNDGSINFELEQSDKFKILIESKNKKLKFSFHPKNVEYGNLGKWFNFLDSWVNSTNSLTNITEIINLDNGNEEMYGYGYIPSRENIFIFKALFSEYGGYRYCQKVEFIRNDRNENIIKNTLYDGYWDLDFTDNIDDPIIAYDMKKYGNYLKIFENTIKTCVFNTIFKSSRRNNMLFKIPLLNKRKCDECIEWSLDSEGIEWCGKYDKKIINGKQILKCKKENL